ncbi:glycolipid transfer protein domain-containing protein [Lipomyces tetrasporus]|uniref:Glycolipid transfer protein domain-containing protein n=1 Tax=Lipomyces tetrasporus TaxID=54092 RepID=A0AAD7VSU0_9ASCO|nr:glycolipid transfer protein domain-containing protein [Lipomyces tetrasporus]KAJ8101452.1 glycolipid transfer protein domain-containing protein [Lipomyces tetrasporus]
MATPTFFVTMKRSFADVPVDAGKVSTTEFLEAAESLVSLFDLLGSAAFTVVQKDMNGNIKKIRERQLANAAISSTLQDIVLSEKVEKNRTATQGLLWLTRGLQFTAVALRKNVESTEELNESFTKAYGETLIKYHSMVIRPVFKLAMKACPYRKDFYAKLGDNQEAVKQELTTWVAALEEIVKVIQDFYECGNYGKGL